MTEIPRILASTARWCAVAKPAGWLTIPGRDGAEGSEPVLLDWVRRETGDAWVVHRLDRETSGVVLFARSEEDHRAANQWFQDRKVKKAYDCLAQGTPALPIFRMNAPVGEHPSVTQFEVKERFRSAFLARAIPRTGRRHQIRIHLAGAGYPILGDPRYGGPSELAGLRIARVALHSASLELPTGERFEAPWPDDFMSWVEALRKEGDSRV